MQFLRDGPNLVLRVVQVGEQGATVHAILVAPQKVVRHVNQKLSSYLRYAHGAPSL